MRLFSVYEAKAKLSQILQLVKTGTKVVITYRGKPVAEIRSLAETQDGSLESRLVNIAEQGFAQTPGSNAQYRFSSVASKQGALTRFLRERE